MDVRRLAIAILACLSITGSTRLGWSQNLHTKYDPAVSSPGKPKQSLLDFTLGRINSTDRDYGWCIEQARDVVLGETIDNGYFWSNVVSLALMGCLFVMIFFQQKRHSRYGRRCAETLSQYEHALLRANGQIEEANGRNDDLMQFVSDLRETASSSPLIHQERPSRSPADNTRQPSSSQKRLASSPAKDPNKTIKGPDVVSTKSKPSNGQIGLFHNNGDVVMKINSQEQQITALREQVNLLRGQLTDSEQRLRAEQDKNRSLKGA